MGDIEAARARRWWLDRPRVGRIDRVAAFIDDVGFAVLFPTKPPMPCLWAVATEGATGDIIEDWGADAMRAWGWKDELPLRKLAWYGPFVRGRKSFLARDLLNDLYPRGGRADDFGDADLSRDARRIASSILATGPMSAAILREATGLSGPPFTKAVAELGRALVITHFGTEEQDAGWPSAVFELTARAFKPKPTRDRVRAARRFLDTMIACKPTELARAFNWTAAEARAALEELVARGEATREGPSYAAAAPLRRSPLGADQDSRARSDPSRARRRASS